MLIKDIMSTDLVTISSDTSIADAKRLMKINKIQRLPVLEKGKLIGLVTEHRVENVSPSKASSLTVWEMGYLLAKTEVKDIMEKKLITVSPDMTVEKALFLAQSKKVGSLLVLEQNKLAGIVTTNDFFYKIANKVLGLGEPGTRISVEGGGVASSLQDILESINKFNLELINIHLFTPAGKSFHDAVIHLKEEDISSFIDDLKQKGYKVTIRER